METPKGAKRQEAHRTPHGKRATWSEINCLTRDKEMRNFYT
ncbi:hypothetical protein P8610_11750 [Fictibacillus sp. UD]